MNLSEVTAAMHREEAAIAAFNKRHNYNMRNTAPAAEVQANEEALARWDALKARRDALKCAR